MPCLAINDGLIEHAASPHVDYIRFADRQHHNAGAIFINADDTTAAVIAPRSEDLAQATIADPDAHHVGALDAKTRGEQVQTVYDRDPRLCLVRIEHPTRGSVLLTGIDAAQALTLFVHMGQLGEPTGHPGTWDFDTPNTSIPISRPTKRVNNTTHTIDLDDAHCPGPALLHSLADAPT